MSYRSLTATLTLYRGGTLSLEEAAKQSGVSPVELTAELRSRGIPVREEARADVTDRTTT
jgi:predicted HTH domain antitoxin